LSGRAVLGQFLIPNQIPQRPRRFGGSHGTPRQPIQKFRDQINKAMTDHAELLAAHLQRRASMTQIRGLMTSVHFCSFL
jgi:hypothetical protein